MTEDDDDVSQMWRDHHAERQQKRADNRQSSTDLLRSEKIEFFAFTDPAKKSAASFTEGVAAGASV